MKEAKLDCKKVGVEIITVLFLDEESQQYEMVTWVKAGSGWIPTKGLWLKPLPDGAVPEEVFSKTISPRSAIG